MVYLECENNWNLDPQTVATENWQPHRAQSQSEIVSVFDWQVHKYKCKAFGWHHSRIQKEKNGWYIYVIFDMFAGSIEMEEYEGLLTYCIPNPTLTWSRMFGLMEQAKHQLNIEDYSLGQTSLEQVSSFTK